MSIFYDEQFYRAARRADPSVFKCQRGAEKGKTFIVGGFSLIWIFIASEISRFVVGRSLPWIKSGDTTRENFVESFVRSRTFRSRESTNRRAPRRARRFHVKRRFRVYRYRSERQRPTRYVRTYRERVRDRTHENERKARDCFFFGIFGVSNRSVSEYAYCGESVNRRAECYSREGSR